ncbi:DMT family transporter [Patescibacteria group bacterium]|nr:DMT family transporter [Patescibacteria group bacterium]
MLWIFIAILGYLFSAIATVMDKYLLAGPIPNPKVYSFYTGVLGILALLFFPLGFLVPNFSQILVSLLAGAIFIWALLWFCKALTLFEASRVVPAIGGLSPLFVFVLNYLFSGKGFPGFWELLSFILLILGSVIITREKRKTASLESFKISAVSAFLFSLAFVLTKRVYLQQPFWSGFIWMRIGGFLAALVFLFSKDVREELFQKQTSFKLKTAEIFLTSQGAGALAFALQNWAIALVPVGLLAFINALEGTKYIFLLIFTILISLKFPQILKEEVSRKILFQKILAILFIGIGLAILAKF